MSDKVPPLQGGIRRSGPRSRAVTVLSTLLLLGAAAMFVAAGYTIVRGPAAGVRNVPRWRELWDERRLVDGVAAPVRIVEFSDFQCPYCAGAQSDIAWLQARYPGKIGVVFHHLPLADIHPHAVAAGVASECARGQGRFREFHDLLFASQGRIGVTPWGRLATEAGIPNANAFARCMHEPAHRERVEQDVRAARKIGISGTPAFIVEGVLIQGSLRQPVVDSIIQARLSDPGAP